MNESLIKVDGVSKKFCRNLKKSLWYGIQDLGNEVLGRRHGGDGELRPGEFWSVKDVSFELKRGECLGLIGPNGAGKSTLLKMLNGLIKPDQGRIEMRGRVGALIELGAGFNPILSGRENIYVNGSVLGFTKEEIDRKLDEIIGFSEIKEFIDSPVQNYSSGMKVKLGFAIAAQMEPDILLIDEVLAVGDVGFRAKCYNFIAKVNKKSSIIFVSHSMSSVGRICSRTIVIDSSIVIFDGEASHGIKKYFSLFDKSFQVIAGSNRAKINNLIFLNNKNKEINSIDYGESLSIIIELTIDTDILYPIIYLAFFDNEMNNVAEVNSRNNGIIIKNDGEKKFINISIKNFILNPGPYTVSCCIYCDKMHEHCAWHFNTWSLDVNGKFFGSASVQFMAEWSLKDPAT